MVKLICFHCILKTIRKREEKYYFIPPVLFPRCKIGSVCQPRHVGVNVFNVRTLPLHLIDKGNNDVNKSHGAHYSAAAIITLSRAAPPLDEYRQALSRRYAWQAHIHV